MNRRFFIVVVLLLLAKWVALSGCGSSETIHSTAPTPAENKPAAEPTSPVSLPTDDGYAAAIFFGADTLGSLDDCGCPQRPEGGLPWRMGYANAFAKQSADVPILHVDAGNFFSDFHTEDGKLFAVAETKNKWLFKGYQKADFAAVNLTPYDLYYAERLFDRVVYQKEKANSPLVTRMISANVRAARPTHLSPPAYLIREINSARLPEGKSLRVGFVGLTSRLENEQGVPKSVPATFQVTDPMVAARRVIPRVRPECDVLVVLAYMLPEKAEQLAKQVSGIDLLIVAHALPEERQPTRVNQTTIAYARHQTRSLGEALLYVDSTGRLKDIKTRMIVLDKKIPPDSETAALLSQAKAEILEEERKLFEELQRQAHPQHLQPLPLGPAQEIR